MNVKKRSFEHLAETLTPHAIKPQLKQAFLKVRGIIYRGNAIFCPCCEKSFKKFLWGGYNGRPNAVCPGCKSLERHRFYWMYLKNETTLFTKQAKMLHVAPERIFQNVFKNMPNLEYLSADLELPEADVKMDITDIQLPDHSFDIILCSHVLEHIPDDRKALKELYRVLKPGGWALLQVPLDPNSEATDEDLSDISLEERHRRFGHHDHYRTYGRDYDERLRSCGFEVRVDDFISKLEENAKEKYGFIPEDIYYCFKG